VILFVSAVITIGYLHTLPYPFHFDDFSAIRDNALLDHPGDWHGIWAFRPSRAIVYYSFALNIALTGRAPEGMRAVNLLIHLLASVLVGWIAAELVRRLNPRVPAPASRGDERARAGTHGAAKGAAPAAPRRPRTSPGAVGLVAALLFASHPLATQSVTYLIQRTTSLAALFELSAVAFYLSARRGHGWVSWAMSWICALLAAQTKEMAVILPAAIGLIELALRRSGAPRIHPALLMPYLAVVPLVGWSAHLYSTDLGRAAAGFRQTTDIGRVTYLLTQLVVIPRYLGLWLWPRGQNLDPDVALHHWVDVPVVTGLALLFVASFAMFLIGRRRPLVTVGWLWFLVMLIPESSVFPISDVMVEHRAYLPMAGLCWGAAALFAEWAGRNVLGVLPPALLVIALTVVTAARNRVWADEASLWTDVTHKSPDKARGFNNLAMTLEARGQMSEAEAAYRRAVTLDRTYLYARVNLGRFYGMQGRFPQALAVLREAEIIAPNQEGVLNNLGTVWWGMGDTTRAVAAYRRALEVAPGAREPAANLARLRGLTKSP